MEMRMKSWALNWVAFLFFFDARQWRNNALANETWEALGQVSERSKINRTLKKDYARTDNSGKAAGHVCAIRAGSDRRLI